MPFDRVTLTLHKAANGTYFVTPAPAVVRWRAKQSFTIHDSDPDSDDDRQPIGQPFRIGAFQADGIFRTATLTFNGKIDDSTDTDNWHPCFDNCDTLKQAIDVGGHISPPAPSVRKPAVARSVPSTLPLRSLI